MPSSSWLVLKASGLRRDWKKIKKYKAGEILLISSCRFPFLHLTRVLLFLLTHSIFTHFFKVLIERWENLFRTGQEMRNSEINRKTGWSVTEQSECLKAANFKCVWVKVHIWLSEKSAEFMSPGFSALQKTCLFLYRWINPTLSLWCTPT